MYFVTLCTTTSAPSASGRCAAGVANVLSTTTFAPPACAAEDTASMSTILSVGLDGVSTQTNRVSARTASRTDAGSVRSQVSNASPHGPSTFESSRYVPP